MTVATVRSGMMVLLLLVLCFGTPIASDGFVLCLSFVTVLYALSSLTIISLGELTTGCFG